MRLVVVLLLASWFVPQSAKSADDPWSTGAFSWTVSEPLLQVDQSKFPASPDHPWLAIKDPSVVRVDGRWHLFCSVRRKKEGQGRIHIAYTSFEDWSEAQQSQWHVLDLTMDYHGAPQIFYFTPHKKWYLVYQAADSTRDLKYGPCYSTNDDISNPGAWTRPEPLYVPQPGVKVGLDFWVICDDTHAHLFHTTNNGKMWRAQTKLENFPQSGWSTPELALEGDIFEASHTYRLKGRDQYVTIIEAQNGREHRYFKAYTADRLDGSWQPLAGSLEKPFCAPGNVVNQSTSFATSYSHGELVRDGVDEKLEVDPANIEVLFQGVNTDEYHVGGYGNIPWKLGILRSVRETDLR